MNLTVSWGWGWVGGNHFINSRYCNAPSRDQHCWVLAHVHTHIYKYMCLYKHSQIRTLLIGAVLIRASNMSHISTTRLMMPVKALHTHSCADMRLYWYKFKVIIVIHKISDPWCWINNCLEQWSEWVYQFSWVTLLFTGQTRERETTQCNTTELIQARQIMSAPMHGSHLVQMHGSHLVQNPLKTPQNIWKLPKICKNQVYQPELCEHECEPRECELIF